MKITRKSMFTGIERTMDLNVTEEQMAEFEEGEKLIQHIFPRLSADEREFIKTGVTSEEWNEVFGKEED